MFAQLKTKITNWWQNQITVLPLEKASMDVADGAEQAKSNLIMLLPRSSYFETYKTYPLSIGKDINKVVKIDARQISPYGGSTWQSALILKQEEQYLVYYFVLLPKYQPLLDASTPLFIVPETGCDLMQLNKGKATVANSGLSYDKDDKDTWVSSIPMDPTRVPVRESATLTPISAQAFFNNKVIDRIGASFTRWSQVKWVSIFAGIGFLYYGTASLYLMAMDTYLTSKSAQTRPVISEIFKLDEELRTLDQQEREIALIYQQSVELSEPLQLLDNHYTGFELEVKTIEAKGNVVTISATANDANGLLQELVKSPHIKQAGFKSDIKKTGKAQAREQFQIEFVWERALWQ